MVLAGQRRREDGGLARLCDCAGRCRAVRDGGQNYRAVPDSAMNLTVKGMHLSRSPHRSPALRVVVVEGHSSLQNAI